MNQSFYNEPPGRKVQGFINQQQKHRRARAGTGRLCWWSQIDGPPRRRSRGSPLRLRHLPRPSPPSEDPPPPPQRLSRPQRPRKSIGPEAEVSCKQFCLGSERNSVGGWTMWGLGSREKRVGGQKDPGKGRYWREVGTKAAPELNSLQWLRPGKTHGKDYL